MCIWDEAVGSNRGPPERYFTTCNSHQILFDDHFNDKIVRACGIYVGKEKCMQSFGGEN